MTSYADIQSAVQAMKLGASDYVAKPVNPDELTEENRRSLECIILRFETDDAFVRTDDAFTPKQTIRFTETGRMHSDQDEKSASEGCRSAHCPPPTILEGESDAAKQLYNYVKTGCHLPHMSVLINGASGTGKEYVAHRIHQLSKRAGPAVS